MEHTRANIADAKAAIKRAVMAKYGGDLLGAALVSVEVSDLDAIRYLKGATIEELI